MLYTLAELATRARTARSRCVEQLKAEYDAKPQLAKVRRELETCLSAELEIIAGYLDCYAGTCDPA